MYTSVVSVAEYLAHTRNRWAGYSAIGHWVIPEKNPPPPPTDGELEILAGGRVKGSGNPGRRGVLDLKSLLRGSFLTLIF